MGAPEVRTAHFRPDHHWPVNLSAMLLGHIIHCLHGFVTSVIHSNGDCYRGPGEETVGLGCVKISVSEIAAVFGATIANSDPASAVPVLIAMDEFNILRAVLRKQPVASCVGNMCL